MKSYFPKNFPNNLTTSSTEYKEKQEQKIKEVSQMYEKLFLKEMLKAMRATVKEGGLIKLSQGEKIFREQLDDQYIDHWSAQGGLGLQKLIYSQIMEKYGAQLGLKKPIEKPKGPIPLPITTNISVHSKEIGDKLSYVFDKPTLVHTPWSGSISKSSRLEGNMTLLEMVHPEQNLKSQFIFRGQPQIGLHGKVLSSGEILGVMDPQAQALFWNIEPTPTE